MSVSIAFCDLNELDYQMEPSVERVKGQILAHIEPALYELCAIWSSIGTRTEI